MTTTEPLHTAAPTSPDGDSRDPVAPAEDAQPWMTFEGLSILAFGAALAAMLLAVFSLGLASRAIDEHRAIPAGGTVAETITVGLKEFQIGTGPITAPAGTSITVKNNGTTTHDLAIEGSGATPQLQPGDDAQLDLSDLKPGTYTVYCQIPGHRESGMETTLTIT